MSSRRFSVEDRNLVLRQNTILEASAGTGKTYSIENIVARLLIDEEPFQLGEILLVTFTKAATAELRERVRSHIEKVLLNLEQPHEDLADYLMAIIEQGGEHVERAKRHLRRALFSFSDAQIYTIHSFCYRMLREQLFEGNFSLDLQLATESERRVAATQVIKDFFRSEIHKDLCSVSQLRRLLKAHKGDSDNLAQAILRVILSNSEVVPVPDFSTLYQAFCEKISAQTYPRLADDYPEVVSHYQKCCKRNGEVKTELLESIDLLDQILAKDQPTETDFDLLIDDGLQGLQVLDRSLLLKKAKDYQPPQHYKELRDNLGPILEMASDPEHTMVCLAARCQQLLRKQQEEDEIIGPDDLLAMMQRSLQNPGFCQQIQAQFSVAIIDEFQDTDPTQWQIFKQLFMSPESKTLVYLVGDPKQSIYRFRNADIYTYFEAVKTLGSDCVATLDTNYRSQPALVDALNTVFSSSSLSRFIDLPQEDSSMEYTEVRAGSSKDGIAFSDTLKPLHFFIAKGKRGRSKSWPTEAVEQTQFFPFIIREILRAHELDKVEFRQIAVLVRDRFQAERLCVAFKSAGIPFAIRRTRSLVKSPILTALQDLLAAALNPRAATLVKRAYGGKIIGSTQEELLRLEEPTLQEALVVQMLELGETLTTKGFASFYEQLLRSRWGEKQLTVAEEILSRQGGHEIYQDLQQLAELVMEEQARTRCPAEWLQVYLDQIARSEEDDERYQVANDSNADAVQVLTLHVSKGLEFDIVFALGLAKRSPQSHRRITELKNGQSYQRLVDKESESYREFCAELDAEKMRQLYVGMTRAKDRLYVPLALEEGSSKIAEGEAAPIELLLSRTGKGSQSWAEDYERIAELSEQSVLETLISWQQGQLSYSILETDTILAEDRSHSQPIAITRPSDVEVKKVVCKIHSFSSIESYLPRERELRAYIEDPEALPAGPEVGNLLHEILAEIPFGVLANKTPTPALSGFLKGSLLHGYDEQVAELFHNVVNTPILPGVTLATVNEQRAFKEMEFLYPWEGVIPGYFEQSLIPGFLKGFIDLIFEHNGKVYVLDYKSNWLESYDQPALKQAMDTHHYQLQAAIYKEATTRYLKQFGSLEFGGCLYCFMRGMNLDPGAGVFALMEEESCQV